MRWRRLFQGIVVAAVAMLFASACLGEEGGGGGGNTGGQTGAGDKSIEIMYGFGGDQSKGFTETMKQFESQSGIKIKFTDASQSFDTLIRPRVQGNNPPDIALFPQPGLMLDFAKQGKLQDLGAMLDINALKGALVPGVLDVSTQDGKTYGFPVNFNVKSLVWYPKKAFEAKGYKVPTTIAELEALTDQIKADGTAPWCVGMESAGATGWVATDWIEDFVLRYGGTQKYDQWVKHEIPFNDPVVKQAASEFEKLALADGNVFGGRKSVVSTNFGVAMNPEFQDPPKCFLHRQGNFITQKGFLTEKVRQNLDEEVGVFQLPGTDASTKPLLVGGDIGRPLLQRRGHQEGARVHEQPRVQVRQHRHRHLAVGGQGVRPQQLPGRDHQDGRQAGLRVDRGPVRRLRHHAGRRGGGQLLEGHDRLGQRAEEP